jgi:hypothetical protein
VPWPPTVHLSERQAPEHYKPPMIYKYQPMSFDVWCIKYRNCLKHVDAYIPSLSTFIILWIPCRSRIKCCLATLRPVEVGDFLSHVK